jgi:hypothetical protein
MMNEQQGYYTLDSGQKLHLSINAWFELEKDTGLKPQEFLGLFIEEGSKNEPNEFILLDLLTDLVYASAKAYNLEEGVNDELNRYKLRHTVVNMGGKGIRDLNDTLISNSTIQYSLGKLIPQQETK